MPELFGGSADLSESNLTDVADGGLFEPGDAGGRNIRFGVREHAMGGIANGIALYGGFIPYAATFLTFSDYMRGAIRLAALSRLGVVYVWTHDSVALGEDGPTHQPIEQVAALRAMPNLDVIRPGDPNEAVCGVGLRRRASRRPDRPDHVPPETARPGRHGREAREPVWRAAATSCATHRAMPPGPT